MLKCTKTEDIVIKIRKANGGFIIKTESMKDCNDTELFVSPNIDTTLQIVDDVLIN
jgi:hypothetical protein